MDYPSQYGIVYTGTTPPMITEKEHSMQEIAIRVDPDDATMKLHQTSRIHYGKVYTIEHNYKVKPYGMVNKASFVPLMNQFLRVYGHTLGLVTQPPQTLREEWTPATTSTSQGHCTQRPTNAADTRQLLPPNYQRALARHLVTPVNNFSSAVPSGSNTPNQGLPSQPNTTGTSIAPPRNPRRSTEPEGFVEGLRQRGFDESQIQAIRDLMARGEPPQYAIARTLALRQLNCTPEAADRIARAVQGGISYENAIAPLLAMMTQRPAPSSGSNKK
jgi:hypothetical protein